ncbi:DUF6588 family protein [Polaribacter uvawellassae]|uniref:DUF6588 family protein n=1 Tax=Polaribacter uvawellassae TaxID=3133495 RepID=UPI00321A88DE
MKRYILIFISVFALSNTTKAQEGFENILLADGTDANKLMEAYFTPAMEGFIYGMNNGWYHTAKVHKILGFDLTVGLSAAMVPSEKEMFSISALGLTSVTSTSTSASTFAGPNSPTTFTVSKTVKINDPGSPANGQSRTVTANFDTPGGVTGDLPLNAVPAPVAQFNLGLPFKMEAMVRFFPETDLGEDGGKASMYGIGLKKEITSWFGPLKRLPLHVSLLAAYTSMDVNYGFADVNSGNFQMANASADFELRSYTAQAIASLNFPFINFYGGIGYSGGTSKFKMTGTYKGEFTYSEGGQSYTYEETLTPPNMEFDASGFKTTIGARFSLWFLKIFADYTIQEYNTVSAGIALSIR